MCYRSSWEAAHPGERLGTYTPQNPNQVEDGLAFSDIDHVLIRCGAAGPTLSIDDCRRVFDEGTTSVSDHYGVAVELEVPTTVR